MDTIVAAYAADLKGGMAGRLPIACVTARKSAAAWAFRHTLSVAVFWDIARQTCRDSVLPQDVFVQLRHIEGPLHISHRFAQLPLQRFV